MISIVVYVLIVKVVTKLRKYCYLFFREYPKFKVLSNEIAFQSKSRHRIRLHKAGVEQIEDKIYLHFNKRIVEIAKVDKIFIDNDFLYFTALGKVKIKVDCLSFYKYFNIKVDSKNFDLEEIKIGAVVDFMNSGFDVGSSIKLKRYLNLITKFLKINIGEKEIKIKQNTYRLPFMLTYKLNNTIKRVYINETLEEN